MVEESQPHAAGRISPRKKVLYSFIVVIMVLGLLELSARVLEIWAPPLEVDYGLGFDTGSRLFQVDPINPASRQTVANKLSNFRSQDFPAKKPSGTFRIAALGGSSVYQLHDELAELSSRIQEQFPDQFERLEIINAGGRAYGSHRLLPILLELLEFDLDMVLIYSGNNEFEEVEQLDLANLEMLDLNRGLARWALVRFIRDRITYAQVRKLQSEHNRRVMASDNRPFGANFVRASRHRWTHEEVDMRMKQYRQNLQIMIQQCRSRNIPLAIGTVPSNLVKPAIPSNVTSDVRETYKTAIESYTRGNFKEGKTIVSEIVNDLLGRHQSSDRENEIIRSLSMKYQVPLADVEKAVIEHEPHGVPGVTLFADHCHLNADGRRLWRETFEPVVISLLDPVRTSAP